MLKERLKARREELGLVQTELAAKIGVSQNLICGIELGSKNPSSAVLALLADALDCSTDYLLGRTDERK